MPSLSAAMLRHRKGGAVATLLALLAGTSILTACALLFESGLRHHGSPWRYAAADVVVARPSLDVVSRDPVGDTETQTVPLPEGGRVPAALLPVVAALPGVGTAVADRSLAAVITAAPALPVTAHGWGSATLGRYRMVGGTPPRADDDVAVDVRLAAATGTVGAPGTGTRAVRPGTRIAVLIDGTVRQLRVSGVVEAPAADAARPGAGAARVFLTDRRAALLDPHPDRLQAIGVLATPGTGVRTLRHAVEKAVTGTGATVLTGDDRGLVGRPDTARTRELLVAAGGSFGGYVVMLVVVVTAGTVGLSVRHRRRDLALLRAVAATPGQVRGMIVGEAALLALVAAVPGVPAGVLAARWTRDRLVGRGFVTDSLTLDHGPFALLAVVAAVALVLLAAVLSGLLAARRTTRIRPSEALGEIAVEPSGGGRSRRYAGLGCLAAALALGLTSGALGGGEAALGSAAGMLYLSVLAVALLGPWINRAVAAAVSPVLERLFGTSGHLAGANLRASARGTVTVLTSLVLAVGFGGSVWFLQDDLTTRTVAQYRDGTTAEQALVAPNGLADRVAAEARAIPGVRAATAVRGTTVLTSVLGDVTAVPAQAVDPDGAEQTLDLRVTSGRLADLDTGTVAVSALQASVSGWKVGGRASLWLGDGTPVSLRVVAVYQRGLGFGDVTLSRRTLAGHAADDLADRVLVRAGADGATRDALAALARRTPGAVLTNPRASAAELQADLVLGAWLNKLLIAVLAGYAALAAGNTMVMAALARRRELALLRLSGVTRRQVRRMVGAEQAVLLGVALAIGGSIAAFTLSSIVHALAGGWIPYVPPTGAGAIVAGTAVLALVTTALPVRRLLHGRPIEAVGAPE